MTDSKVYVIGSDGEQLGLGDLEFCRALTEVPDLSGKKIEEFYEGQTLYVCQK